MTDRQRTERLGVNAVEQLFLKTNWVFRNMIDEIVSLLMPAATLVANGIPRLKNSQT